MVDPMPFDKQADDLTLRAKPRPVTQINRKLVIVMFGGLGLLLFLAATIALDPPTATDPETPRELYNTRSKPKADALASLPSSYDQMPAATVPQLGPPLSGDLGAMVVQTERELGLSTEPIYEPVHDFRPNPVMEAERADAIRKAKLRQESLESPVFFQIGVGQASQPDPADSPQPIDPFAALTAATEAFASTRGLPGVPGLSDVSPQPSKTAFAGEGADGSTRNDHVILDPLSPYQVMAGTIIPASLITGLNSDLPGTIIAQVTQPIYDTVTGAFLLIPQGTRLIGRYKSQVSFGQDRALIVWDRILFPDGASLQIEALPATDQAGYAGLSDRVDHHWGRVFTAAGLASLLGIGTELAVDTNDGLASAVRDSFQDTVNQAGQRMVDRNLNIQPSLKVRPGWPLRVIVTRDLILRPYQ